MKLRLILLLWTVLSFSGNSAQARTAPTAVLNPAKGVNASLGSTVTFTCIINGTEDVLWRVDGTSDPTVQRQMGITQNSTVGQPDGTFISRIHVLSTMENNGIEILCRAIGTLSDGQSETVTLFVQGLLSSPTALGISDSEGPTRRLSWTPPPTLDLTNVHPDISHYNVCSSILNEVSCNDVQGTELSFLNIRIGIEFSVVAVNVVGEGNASTINHEPCDSTTAPTQVDGDLVTSDISLQSSGTTPSVTFSFGKGGGDANCFNLYRIEASPSNQGTPLTRGPMFPTVSGGEDNSVSVTSGLVRNTVYSVSIVSVNVNGENPSKGDIQLSAYDVQSIQSSTRPGVIAVTCSFTTGSVASSCIVRICEVINGNVSMMCQDLSVPRSPSASETTQELNDVQPGVYAIVGVTVNSGGGEMIPFTSGDLRFLQLQNINVTEESPTTATMATEVTVENILSFGVSVALAVILTFLLTLALGISIGVLAVNKCRKSENTTLQTETEMMPPPVIYEDLDDIKPDPFTQGNVAYELVKPS